MPESPHSTQDLPQIKASILDMDSDALANTKTIEEMLQALGSTSITIQASDKKQLKPKTEEKKPPPILTISQSLKINAARVEEIEKKLPAFGVQKTRLYEALPKLTSEFVANKASEESLDLSSSDTKKSKRISEEDKLIQALASKNNKTIAEQKLITYRDFLTGTNQLMNFNQTLDRIEDLNNQEKIFSNHLNLLRPLSLQPQIANKEEGLKIEQKKFETLIISQLKEPTPLSILLQTSSFDTEQKKILDKLRDKPAESIFPIKESDPRPDSQSSGAPPLPTHVAIWAKSCLAEKQGKKASRTMQAELIRDNSKIEALQASKAEAIDAHIRLEVEISQIRQELEEIEQRNEALSDSIPLDNPNLEEVIAREEELKRVLEEKQKQENIIIKEAWRIQQELIMQKAIHGKQNGEIPGLRPGQKPEIATTQIHLQVPIANTPFPNSNLGILEEVPWYKKYLANLGEEELSVEEAVAQYSLQPQEPYSPFQTLSDLQILGAGPFALGLGNTQMPAPIQEPQATAQDLSLSNQPLAPAQTSLQHPQANAKNTAQEVASLRKTQEKTSAIFTRVSNNENLVTDENPESHSPPSDTELEKLLKTLSENEAKPLSANQPLGGLQSEDLTNLYQSTETENKILELQQTQPNQYSEVQVFQPQNTEQNNGELGSSAQQDDAPPQTMANEVSQTLNNVPILNLDKIENNTPPTKLRTQEEKKQFWQTFISTRLETINSTLIQYSPRNNEDKSNENVSNQDKLANQSDNPSQPSSSALESENSDGSTTHRSTLPYSTTEKGETDETEERKKRLYEILLANLEEQITKKLNSSLNNENSGQTTDEKENTAEMNETDATTIFDTVMDYIVTYTPDLDSSISEVGNNQTGETYQYEASDPQTTQNSSTDDPIIYSGIGIRIKLEKEERGEYFLRITEVFENSDLHETEDVDKKITHVEFKGNLKSISAIYGDCEGDEKKFYTEIAFIFRDRNENKLKLRINDEEKIINKNIFIPEERTVLNVTNYSQMTKIAEKLKEQRPNFSQLTRNNSSEERRIA